MVTAFADAPLGSLELGNFTWIAGPLAKGPGLCHRTSGNG
jgi:hypothetical protein